MPSVAATRLTPVLCVDDLGPSLEFWCGRMGWTKTVEVPHGDGIGFAILEQGGVELMLQSRASIAAEHPHLAAGPLAADGVMLFVEVADLDPVIAAAAGCEIVVPERTTFYGMRELAVRAPGGIVAIFAQKVS